ncbi:MAG: helix-turn-helix domain-containing protein [Pseudomonadota bacterium]
MKTFDRGMFYGDVERRRRVGDIELAELQPTVPEHEVETHTHTDAHFVFVLAGRYLSRARGMPPLGAGPALIYNPPGTTHRDCFRGLDGRFLTVSMPAAAVSGRDLPLDPQRVGALGERAARALRDELRRWDACSALAVEGGVDALLQTLQRQRRMARDDGPAWLARARERLHDDCAHPPRIEELARIAGVHPVAFARTFRRRYGRSPGEYLRECRLERAATLLRDRRRTLTDIAMQSGFVDASHFSRAFRQAFGCTPTEYRRAH